MAGGKAFHEGAGLRDRPGVGVSFAIEISAARSGTAVVGSAAAGRVFCAGCGTTSVARGYGSARAARGENVRQMEGVGARAPGS